MIDQTEHTYNPEHASNFDLRIRNYRADADSETSVVVASSQTPADHNDVYTHEQCLNGQKKPEKTVQSQPLGDKSPTPKTRIRRPIPKDILFYNQPSLESDPPTILIVSHDTIVVDGVRKVLSDKERVIFNGLVTNRDKSIRSKTMIDKGFPKSSSMQATRSSFSSSLRAFREDITVDGRPLVETEGIRGGAKHALGKDVLVIDQRGRKKRAKTTVKKQPRERKQARRKERRRDFTKPFVDIEQAKAIVPEVFEAKYDNSDESADRFAVRGLAQLHRNDPAVLNRIEQAYGGRRGYAGTSEVRDAWTDFTEKAAAYRVFTADEAIAMFKKMKVGVAAHRHIIDADKERPPILEDLVKEGSYAYHAIFKTNLRLVLKEVFKHSSYYPHLEQIDIAQYGYTGLHTAIEKFDEDKGFRFSTYATLWIRQAIQRNLDQEARIIRLPSHEMQKVRKLQKTEKRLAGELGRQPSDDEILEATGLQPKDLRVSRIYGDARMASLNKKIGDDEEAELGEMIADDKFSGESIEQFSAKEEVKQLLGSANLNLREKYVLSLKYGVLVKELEGTSINTPSGELCYEEAFDSTKGDSATTTSITKMLGISRQTVMNTESSALAKISQSIEQEAA